MTARRQHGTGSLREIRPGVWRIIVDRGQDPATGNRRQRSATVHGNKRAAQARLDELRAENPGKVTTSVTLAHLDAAWWPTTTLAPSTIANWRPLIDRWLLPELGATKLRDLTPPVIVMWHHTMAAKGAAAHTAAKAHMILGRMLSHAQALGWVTINAARLAPRPKAQTRRRRSPGSDVGRLLLDAAAGMGPVVSAWLRVVLVTGARRGEVLALRWTDLDAKRTGDAVDATVTIARSLTAVSTAQRPGRRPRSPNGEQRTGSIVEKTTKTDRTRVVALDDATFAELVGLLGHLEAKAAEVGMEFDRGGYLFPGSVDGARPMRPEWATKMHHRLCDAAGVGREVRLHDLRHRAASVAMAAGLSAQATADHLGHAKPSMTLDRYGGSVDDEGRRVAAALARSLDGEGATWPPGMK